MTEDHPGPGNGLKFTWQLDTTLAIKVPQLTGKLSFFTLLWFLKGGWGKQVLFRPNKDIKAKKSRCGKKNTGPWNWKAGQSFQFTDWKTKAQKDKLHLTNIYHWVINITHWAKQLGP